MNDPHFHTVTAWLAVDDARRAHDFYADVFEAVVLACEPHVGPVRMGVLRFGDSLISVVDPMPQVGLVTPKDGGTCSIALNVADADAMFARAVDRGAHPVAPIRATFAGERHGVLLCPFGHRWILSTRTEDLRLDEIVKRFRRALSERA